MPLFLTAAYRGIPSSIVSALVCPEQSRANLWERTVCWRVNEESAVSAAQVHVNRRD
ncbi:TPP-dependent indolepyruvate ferredoxin oxidoreductase alpha subunit [Sinorhizobium fredii]